MKTLLHFLIFALLVIAFEGCKDKITDRYRVNSPVYMKLSEFRTAVKIKPAEAIIQPGKIYLKDNLIFINESFKGIHVIDNSNPATPLPLLFINIPGNVDIAIKDSILYADSFIDLVALNISDINNIHETGRVDSIFPYTLPPLAVSNHLPYAAIDTRKGIIVGWETKTVEQEVQIQPVIYPFYDQNYGIMTDLASNTKIYSQGSGSASMTVGIGGSMARFNIYNNILYILNNNYLKAFDIQALSDPVLVSTTALAGNVETLFQYGNKLFFGTQTGMLIYDISNASNPQYLSTFSHIRSCDPVVVEGDYAYVTLRSGNRCGEATSQLEIINISNLENLVLEQSYPMQSPYGLGIDNKTVFVCEGNTGLMVYNADNPKQLVKIAGFSDVNAIDVIPYNGILIMIGDDGLYEYQYSNPSTINLLSEIPISGKSK